MLNCKLAGRRKKMTFLGSTGSTGGGGSELWLPELGGSLRWVAGGLVEVSGGLNWVEEGCGGSC